LTTLEQDDSYSVHAVVVGLGGSAVVGRVVAIVLTAALIAGAAAIGRRGNEAGAIALAAAAALTLSPIVWQHYLVLLLVPLAIRRPRLSPIWFLPLALWACDLRGDNGDLWQTILVPLVGAALVVWCLLPSASRSARRLA
jgi:hypothetical protein